MARGGAAARAKKKTSIPLAREKRPDQYSSRALEKGLQAIEELSYAPEGLTLLQAAAKLGLAKPSAFRIMRTLENLGYAAKTFDGRYSLTASATRQLPARSVQLLIRHGGEPLRALVEEFRETASLAGLFENHIEVVMVVESPELIRMTNTLGRILPPHGSSLGKAIASFLDRNTREHLLRTYGTAGITPHTITDPMELAKEFDRIRSAGHAEDWEESTPGGVCFAAPVLRAHAVPAGAISVSLPRMRLEGENHQRRIITAVRRTAAAIASAAFGA